jgi:hypothetical protein
LSTNYSSFQHITQPTGDQQKFDNFAPALEANIFYKNKSENTIGFGFLVNGFRGTNKDSFNYSTTVGSHGSSDAADITFYWSRIPGCNANHRSCFYWSYC